MHTVYGVAERITVLDVQKARLRVLFALRLVSGATIFKSAGFAEAARMPLVPRSSEFFARKTRR